ncbi:MAG: ABC transporter permease [Dermabacter sp.]|nr:ABC transporter permease [Dermabacter sp.]
MNTTATSENRKELAPPARRAAPALQRVLAHARLEARILLTNGEQLMVALVLPAFVLLGLVLVPLSPAVFGGHSPTITDAVAATATTGIIATAMTSQAITTGFDRRGGVLRWIATTPLGRSGYLAGKTLALGIIHVLQVIVLGAVALGLGWRPQLTELALSAPVWILGAAAFGALGLLIAGLLRAEAVLALSNIFFLLLVALGGVVFPASNLPGILAPLVGLLPSAALMSALSATLEGHWPPLVSLALLLGWAALFTVLTVKYFKWTSA